jgi:hypothetical protein
VFSLHRWCDVSKDAAFTEGSSQNSEKIVR